MPDFLCTGKTGAGIVKDKSGEPMIGVNVLVKGTTNGTITGVDGDFTLSGVKKSDILSFTYIGFKNKELKYEGEKLLNVVFGRGFPSYWMKLLSLVTVR